MNIYRTFYPSIAEYTFFLSTHITFTKTGHILSHEKKTSINFKKLKSYSIFSDHSMFSEIKLEISNRKITGKFLNTWKLNNILLNNP